LFKRIVEHPTIEEEVAQFDELKTVFIAGYNFASIQTTAKEKEFCERLEEISQQLKNRKGTARNANFNNGYNSGLSLAKSIT